MTTSDMNLESNLDGVSAVGIIIKPKFNAAIEYEEGFVRLSFSRRPDNDIVDEIKKLKLNPSFAVTAMCNEEIFTHLKEKRKELAEPDKNLDNNFNIPRYEWSITFALTYDCLEVAESIKTYLSTQHSFTCRLVKLEDLDDDIEFSMVTS
jgi:hypothetical protein